MSRYLLILHEDPSGLADVSPEEMQRIVERYSAWAGQLAERGQHLGGNKLTDDGGRWLQREGESVVASDGPYTEAKEVIGGYFLIQADDLAQAESLASDCPHLEYGGRIELRQVEDLPGEPE